MPPASLSENIIGKNLKIQRQSLRLSQSTFAHLCTEKGWTISRNVVAKIETGLRRVYDWEVIFLCELLQCSPNQLLKFSDKATQRIVKNQSLSRKKASQSSSKK